MFRRQEGIGTRVDGLESLGFLVRRRSSGVDVRLVGLEAIVGFGSSQEGLGRSSILPRASSFRIEKDPRKVL